MDHQAADAWRRVLRAELAVAMRARESRRVGVVRTLLAAIDNAEAVDPGAAPPPTAAASDGVVAGGVAGLGAGEVPRRALAATDLRDVLSREIDRRRAAADDLVAGGRADRADDLLAEVAVLESLAGRLVAET